MSLATCYITFENFWGEELRHVTISHSDSTYEETKQGYSDGDTETIHHIQDKQILTDIIKIAYIPNLKDYWNITITTMYGQTWFNKGKLSCSIKPEDNHRIIIGVNGQSKRMYAAFSVSSSCSASLTKLV